MDPTFPTVIFCFLLLIDMPVCATPGGYIGWPHDGAGSWWHVFRQVHASEVASRQLLSASRNPSSKVAETMRIIPIEERRSEPSFTIISRIKSPLDQILTLFPPRPSWTPGFLGRRAETAQKEESTSRTASFHGSWPSQNASNFLIIGEAEPVLDHQRGHVETSRQNDNGFYTVEKGLVRYRGGSHTAEEEAASGNGRYPHQSSSFGLWEMLKMRRPQKWDVLNKLLTHSTTEVPTTTSTKAPLSWNVNESSRLENDDSVPKINSLAAADESTTGVASTTTGQQPDTITDRNQNQSDEEDSGLIHSQTQSDKPHQLDSWLVVRIDDSTCYAATTSFDNGTIVFQRFGTDGLNPKSGWRNLSYIEAFYPGFGQAAGAKPSRLIVQSVVRADADEPLGNNVEEKPQTPQTVVMGNQTVLIPSNSPWAGNETVLFPYDVAEQINNTSERQTNSGTDNNEDVAMEQELIRSRNETESASQGSEPVQNNTNQTTTTSVEETSFKNETDDPEITVGSDITMQQELHQMENNTDVVDPEVTTKTSDQIEMNNHSNSSINGEKMAVEISVNQNDITRIKQGLDKIENNTDIVDQEITTVGSNIAIDNSVTEIPSQESVKNQLNDSETTNQYDVVVDEGPTTEAQTVTDLENREITTESSMEMENGTEMSNQDFTTEIANENVTMEEAPTSSNGTSVENVRMDQETGLELLNSGFRKVEDEEPEEPDENSVDEFDDQLDSLQHAVNLAVPVVVSNVTDMPSSSTEEQMAPPLLKNLENLLLTHLLPPTSSMSSVSSTSSPSPPSPLHHSPPARPVQPVDDWAIVSQIIKPVGKPLTSSLLAASSTPSPRAPPAYSDPSRNEAMWSSHSVIIPSRNPSNSILQLGASSPHILRGVVRPSEFVAHSNVFTTDQLSLMAVSEKPPISSTPSTLPTVFPSPIQMFTLRPESSVASLAAPVTNQSPPKKKSGGIASLILAHTSALMSGKNSPFFNAHRYNPNSNNNVARSDDRQTKKNPSPQEEPIPKLAPVHIITAMSFPDPEQEEEMRHRSIDSGVLRRITDTTKTANSTWAFPSFDQLIESPDLVLPASAADLSSPIEEDRPSAHVPISSYHGNPVGDLPQLPRFTCGQQTTEGEVLLTNPSYPNPDDHAGRCGFRLLVTSNHVCQVRIQFRDSRMLLPRQGSCVDQFMTVTESTAGHPSVVEDKFCGWNSDQHFYLELAEPGSSPRHVDFKINTKSSSFLYRYSLIIQQIDCVLPNPLKAPSGCFQYFNSLTGVIKSFNYDGGQYWNKQSYRICVRSVDQSCTLALSSADGNFGLQKSSSRRFPADRSGVGTKACPRDYLWIPGSIQSEENTESGNIRDRYCGAKFSDRHGDSKSRVVMARMYSSVHIMEFRAGVSRSYDAQHHGPGFRLNFLQTSQCPSQPKRNEEKEDETEPGIEDEDYNDDEIGDRDEGLFGNLRRLRSVTH